MSLLQMLSEKIFIIEVFVAKLFKIMQNSINKQK